MNKETKHAMETAVNSLIERFDQVEQESRANFLHAKRIILNWAKKHKLFSLE